MLQLKWVIPLFFHGILLFFNITITRNTVVVGINFKSLNFKTLTNILLDLTMFIQRTDNLVKLVETTLILTFANWEHKVRYFYALIIMIDNVSYVSCSKNFPGECVCTFCFDPMFTFSFVTLHWLLCFLLKVFIIFFSGTVRPRGLKLGTHVNNGWMYCVYRNQAAAADSSFCFFFFIFLSLQLSSIKIFCGSFLGNYEA